MAPEQSSGKIGKSVGERLRAARVAQHYTQSQLAAPDFSVSYISAIERGQIHPSLRALEILAGRLGLTSTDLLPKHTQQNGQQTSPTQPEREDDEGEMALLETQILIRQGNAEQAIARLAKMSAKRLKRDQQVQYRYLLGRAYFLIKRLQESEQVLSGAIQLAQETNNHYLHIQILNMLGIIYAAMQDYPQALLHHQRCLNMLEESEPRDAFLITEVRTHLGQHHMHLQNLDEALTMFNKALSTAEEFNTARKAQAIYREISQYYIDTNDFFVSTIYAYQSLQLSQQEAWKHLKGDLYHYLGKAVIRGDQQEAYTYLTSAEEKESQDQLIKASITTRMGEWYFARQQIEQAEQCTLEAYRLARPFGDTIIAADALVTLGRIEYVLENFTHADEHFTTGLDMLERLDSQEELADQSIRYAQLLEERGKDREAFTYFRRAYQSGNPFS